MARASTRYVCQDCGAVYPRWQGRCEGCGAWDTVVEEAAPAPLPGARGGGTGGGRRRGGVTFTSLEGETTPPPRLVTGVAELDRVCGGGIVPGSAILVGGDPGIGKSTLLLQATSALAGAGVPCAYVTGEEAVDQVRLRARRLGLSRAPLALAAATNVGDLLATLEGADGPRLVVIDSIQTMFLDTLDSAPGTVSQVRASAQALIRLAKQRGFALFLVGHVTKEGQIAGPRVLEHMVDTVLYFEGERGYAYRILRAVKNRFGATDEIGVFEMTEAGLSEVANPSALFLAERHGNISGACVFAGVEGSRPVLVEIQALVAPSSLATPRRAVVGWDGNRLAMVLAVLEARCGVALTGRDIYLNVAGGLRITEPAADLAVAAALVSSATDTAMNADTVVFGEIGLSGEIRPVSHADIRLKEAGKLGFAAALAPRHRAGRRRRGAEESPLQKREIGHLTDLVDLFPQATGGRG